MRTSVIVGLLMLALVALGMRAQVWRCEVVSPAYAAEAPPRPPAPAKPAAAARQAGKIVVRTAQQPPPIWKAEVTGDPQTTAASAHHESLRKAAVLVGDFMRERFPGYRYEPTPKFLEDSRLVVETKQTEQVLAAENAPTMISETLTVELRDAQLALLLQEDRRERSVERLWQGGRILGGVLVGLLALIGYVRLDDWTKGYFSVALKLTAIALAVAGAVLLWWLV